ncbi:MAG: BtrH N-terminal domain-containing protein [Deltaproteobacteria bacterium]
MIINDFSGFNGQHCETTATGSLLNYIGLELSEPMLFGIGEGLGFIYWDMKNMNFPFIGGRIKPEFITRNIVNNLELHMDVKETSSVKAAWDNVKGYIDSGIPVGLKLDAYYLEYFTNKFHFAAHYVAMYGYDKEYAYLADTVQQGGLVKSSLKSIEMARNERGAMSSRNLSYTITQTKELPKFEDIILKAIKRNAEDFLNPPIKNIGYKGIEKLSKEIRNWFEKGKDTPEHLKRTAILMEKAGTGGAIFRNIFRDFLKESMTIIESKNLQKAYNSFCDIAQYWGEVSSLIGKAGETNNSSFLNEASGIVLELSKREKEAMSLLLDI